MMIVIIIDRYLQLQLLITKHKLLLRSFEGRQTTHLLVCRNPACASENKLYNTLSMAFHPAMFLCRTKTQLYEWFINSSKE